MTPERRQIGRVQVDVLDCSSAIEAILADARAGRPDVVAFCNAHTVNVASRDDRFASALKTFRVLNDGVGVDLASRLLFGRTFPQNLCGTDFVPALLEAAGSGLRIFLLGSAPGVAAQAGAALQQRFPGHSIVGTHHGFFSADQQEDVCTLISDARPNLILVGMGQPHQEFWAARHFDRFPAVTMCVGAFLEFTAGTFPRAPRWLRAARLEWAYRLAREPVRLGRRYLVGNFEFLFRLLRDKARHRRIAGRSGKQA